MTCAVVATAAVSLLAPATALPAGVRSRIVLTSLESDVVARLNEVRVAHGLQALTVNASLSAAANHHCVEMAADGFFAHQSAGGGTFVDRLARYYPPAGHGNWSVGENLVWSSRYLDAVRAVRMWMASPHHRANLLSPLWRDIGVSALTESDAPGAFDNLNVTLIVTDFGARGA